MKLILPVVMTACVAWAQAAVEPSGAAAVVKPADGAPAPAAEATPAAERTAPAEAKPVAPPAPPTDVPPLLPPAFHDQVMSWDSEHHQALQGFARKPLSRDEFFTLINRPDLVEKSDALTRRRVILAGSAVLVAAAGVISGWLVLANNVDCTVNPGGNFDTSTYNQCTDDHKTNGMIGGSLIVAGVIGAGLLASFAYWSKPEVVDDDEAQRLISQFNGQLLKRLRLNAIWLPGGGALGLSARF